MRTTFDFAPLFRSSIGFDRMLNALETGKPGDIGRQLAALRHRQDR